MLTNAFFRLCVYIAYSYKCFIKTLHVSMVLADKLNYLCDGNIEKSEIRVNGSSKSLNASVKSG